MNTRFKFFLAVSAASLMFAVSPGWSQGAGSGFSDAGDTPQYVPNEVLVKFSPSATAADRIGARRYIDALGSEVITTPLMKQFGSGELELMKLPVGLTVAKAMSRLNERFGVEYAEPNWIYQHNETSNDPYYTNGSLWGMYGDTSPTWVNAYGSQAAESWAASYPDCSSVYVGIIDEGYMYTHEDLASNVGTNVGEIAGDGIDNDSNGYVDDVYGWDFEGANNTVFDGLNDDHGTHVAGTIGGVGGNGIGVAGVCWKVKLMNAKFLGRKGGTTVNAIRAVDYFTDLKYRGMNFVATNNSWGVSGGYSQALRDAIDRAGAANIVFIAAAGNSGVNNDISPFYPASYTNENIISVASISSSGSLSSFSNYGATSVDLGAPGRDIWSTVPAKSGKKIVSRYASYSGTSMAAPHVTGAVALIAARNPTATPLSIKNAILTYVVPTPALSGKTVTGGRLNVSGF